MDPLLEDSIPHWRARNLASSLRERKPSRFEQWALEPIYMFRIGIFLFYLGCIYFGVTAFLAGIPSFTLTAPPWFTQVWSVGVAGGGAVAMLGSVGPVNSRLFQWLGRIGSFFVWVGLFGYSGTLHYLAYQPGDADINRVAAAAGFATMGTIPIVHFAWLMSRIGVKQTRPVSIDPDEVTP